MVLAILINWDQRGSPICAFPTQYFFLKYNLYYLVLIKILEMSQAVELEIEAHNFMSSVPNNTSNVSTTL